LHQEPCCDKKNLFNETIRETSLLIGARFVVNRERKGASNLREKNIGKSATITRYRYTMNFNRIDTSPFDPRMHARLAYIIW